MAWAKNGTPDTLSGSGAANTISDLTAKKFHVFLHHELNASGFTNTGVRFDNDSGTVYAERTSDNGSEGTATSETSITVTEDSYDIDKFQIAYVCNINGEEALLMAWNVAITTAGASAAPERCEAVGKDAGTTQFTRVDFINRTAETYAANSNLSALGTD